MDGTTLAADVAAAAPPRRAAFAHAGLVWTLVRTDFKARYHGTIGGLCGPC
jgi:hypothetical protein